MLIKYYTKEMPQTLHIIENVTHVSTSNNVYSRGDKATPMFSNERAYCLDDISREGEYLRYINFTANDGVRSYLEVAGRAYICNNEGKTIETVSPN